MACSDEYGSQITDQTSEADKYGNMPRQTPYTEDIHYNLICQKPYCVWGKATKSCGIEWSGRYAHGTLNIPFCEIPLREEII